MCRRRRWRRRGACSPAISPRPPCSTPVAAGPHVQAHRERRACVQGLDLSEGNIARANELAASPVWLDFLVATSPTCPPPSRPLHARHRARSARLRARGLSGPRRAEEGAAPRWRRARQRLPRRRRARQPGPRRRSTIASASTCSSATSRGGARGRLGTRAAPLREHRRAHGARVFAAGGGGGTARLQVGGRHAARGQRRATRRRHPPKVAKTSQCSPCGSVGVARTGYETRSLEHSSKGRPRP